MKIRPLEAELFHADGKTGRHMTKIINTFLHFANAPKIGVFSNNLHKSNACCVTHACTA
jgi:hypothetical protein